MIPRSAKLFFSILPLLISTSFVIAAMPIEYVRTRSYFEVVLQEINQARQSIKVYMFVIAAGNAEPGSKVMKLLDGLVAAKGRGVEVEVHLDQNYSFGGDESDVEGKNDAAAAYLKERGVAVYYDEPADYTHSKAVVIDGRVTIFGSSNWSKSAFDINNETNAIVRSEEFAREVLKDLGRVKNIVPDLPEEIKVVRIPTTFTAREDLMGKMVSNTDERAFDIYLILLNEFDGNAEGNVKVNYDGLATSLGIDGMPKNDYRRQISKVLRKLQDEYKLISAEIKFDEPAEVVLKNQTNPTEIYRTPQDEFISFPEDYWNFGWGKRLSFAGKVMLLLNWEYSKGSLANWQRSVAGLAEGHHISSTFIGDGTQELRRMNLIDIRYKVLEEEAGRPRWLAVYSPNLLYNPDELNKRFENLAGEHGKEAVERAKAYARVVYKENDFEDVTTLIGLEKQFGQQIVQEAVGIMEAKAINNPKRHIGYLVGTIRGLAERRTGLKG